MALAKGNLEVSGFLDSWLELNKHDGTLDELYHFWILWGGISNGGEKLVYYSGRITLG